MDYVFAGLWLVVGLLLIFRFGRENKVFYLLGAFFLFLAGGWIADILLPVDLFAGVWPWVLRALALCALAAACVAYYREMKRNKAKGRQQELPEDSLEDWGAGSLPPARGDAEPPAAGDEKDGREE